MPSAGWWKAYISTSAQIGTHPTWKPGFPVAGVASYLTLFFSLCATGD